MADVNLPTFGELSNMEFASPMAFDQMQKQIGLANQFQQQNLKSGDADLAGKLLNNLFAEQNNPQKIQRAALENDQLGYTNRTKKIDTEQREALAPDELAAKRSAFVKQLSDDKLEKALSDAQKMMLDDDPTIAAKGQDLFMRSGKEQSARAKAKDELAKQEATNASHERVATGNNAATVEAAKIQAGGREAVAKLRSSNAATLDDQLAKYGRTFEARAGIYDGYARRATQDGDVEMARYYQAMGDRERQESRNKATAGADARNAASPDINTLGVKTLGNQAPPVPQAPQIPVRGGDGGMPQTPPQGLSTGGFQLAPDGSNIPALLQTINTFPPEQKAAALRQLEMQINNSGHGGPRLVAPQPQAPAPQAVGPKGPVISDPNSEEFKRLPKGATFVTPDGRELRKK